MTPGASWTFLSAARDAGAGGRVRRAADGSRRHNGPGNEGTEWGQFRTTISGGRCGRSSDGLHHNGGDNATTGYCHELPFD